MSDKPKFPVYVDETVKDFNDAKSMVLAVGYWRSKDLRGRQ